MSSFEIDEVIRACVSVSRQTWPGVAITGDRFAAYLRTRGARAEDVVQNGQDLYLACACEDGEEVALRWFEARLMPSLDGLFRRMRIEPERADEIRQSVRVLLLAQPTMQIAAYTGRGSLSSWLRTVAARVALKVLAGRDGRSLALADEIVAKLADGRVDPEWQAIRARVGEPFQRALSESLLALTPRAKAVLRLHYIRGLDIDTIGDLYKVHRSTVARWLAATRTLILTTLRQRLNPSLPTTSSEFNSLVKALRDDDLELSLDDLLGEDLGPSAQV
jgi:RNA polymerase sigma-70 factor, ECF subfamily